MSTSLGATAVSFPTTQWPHQRRQAIVGDRIVSVYNPFGDNLYVKWATTSNSAQTDYAAYVPGWTNGSFVCYEQPDGTWRALTAWIQTTTVGGRNDGWLYVMVGTFATDLSTLTWGAAVAIEDPALVGGDIHAPDLDVVVNGSGGAAMLVWSVIGSFGGIIRAAQINVSSGGSATVASGTFQQIAGPWSGASEPGYPSVAIDPVSKHVGVFYSTGQTSGQAGPNFGSRFRKGTWGGSTWAWGTERPIDPVIIPLWDGVDAFTATCRWDAETQAWVMGGYLALGFPSPGLRVRVWQVPLAANITDQIFAETPGTLLGSGSLAVDPSSGNVHLFASRHSSLGSPQSLKMRVLSRSTASTQLVDGGLTTIDTSTDISGIASLAVPGAMHLLYGQGTASSWTVQYLKVALQLPPNAPVLLTPTDGIGVNVAQTQRFSWGTSFPTPGDTQSAYRRSIKEASDPTFTTGPWVSSSAARVDDPAGTYTAGVSYEWFIEVKGQTGLASPSSTSEFFEGVGAPADLAITAPPNFGTVGARYDVEWTVTDQDSFQVRVVADNGAGSPDTGTAYFDTGEIVDASARTVTVILDTSLVSSGATVHTQVRVKDSGVWSDWDSVFDSASFVIPGLVVGTLAYIWRNAVNVIEVTADRAVAVGVRVYATNFVGEPDPILPPPDPDLDLRVDAGGDGGVF